MKHFINSFLFILGVFCICAGHVYAADGDEGGGSGSESSGSSDSSTEEDDGSTQKNQELPLLDIRRLEQDNPVYSIELRNVELSDLFRIIAHDYDLNIIIDEEVKGKVTASFTNISLEEALDKIAQINNLILVDQGSVILVKPGLITEVFVLKHVEASILLEDTDDSDSVSDLSSGESSSDSESGSQSGTEDLSTTTKDTTAGTIYDLLSEQGKIFLAKQPNSIMVIDYPENVEKVRAYLKMVDQGMDVKVFRLKYIKAQDVVNDGGGSESGQTPAGGQTGSSSTQSGGSGG